MRNRIDDELVPFLALWLFAGIRKEEVSRLTDLAARDWFDIMPPTAPSNVLPIAAAVAG